MAPVRKRSSIRARAAAATKPVSSSKPFLPGNGSSKDPQPRLTKKDKRAVKHNILMSRVKDAGITKSTSKRRRPTKKLQAAEGLADDLRDALPDVAGAGDEGGDDDGWEGFSDVENLVEYGAILDGAGLRKRRRRKVAKQDSKMVMRSLNHRPGAMKRKHQMHQREVERFGKNLAQLTGEAKTDGGRSGVVAGTTADGQSVKWAALRNFISSTMERDPAFATR